MSLESGIENRIAKKMMAVRLIVGVLAINLVMAGIIVFSLMQSKKHHRERAEVTTQNITQILEESLTGTISVVDIAIQSVTDEAERQLAGGAIQEPVLSDFIKREHSRLPQLIAFRATNASGDAIYGSAKKAAVTTSLAHRDYFARLRDNLDAGLVISKPLVGGISGKWMIILARRINNPDRSFAGLVYAGISLDYLTGVFSKINVGSRGVVALLDSDFGLVARYPEHKSAGSEVGKLLAAPTLRAMVKDAKTVGTYTNKSSFDGELRTFSFRRLNFPSPFYLSTGLATAEYLAAWRAEAFLMSTFLLILTAATIFSAWFIYEGWCRNREAEEVKTALERQLLQSQKLESLGLMAGGIAHDFNNLLQSILGNMELALRTLNHDSAAKEFVNSAMTSGKKAAHLTSLMLAYVGKGQFTRKSLNLNQLVSDNADILKSAATSCVSLQLSLSEDSCTVTADEAQIQQVVMNLITNAAEAIDKQSGFVKITTGVRFYDQAAFGTSLLREKPEPGRYAFLEVSDNGCGMDRETISRLFDPFFTTKFTGRGLGMSAVMGIVKSHAGALFVESEVGAGTTFRVLFPASESLAPMESQEKAPSKMEIVSDTEVSLSGLVLVVDDDKTVLRTCSKMVKLCGFEVITAFDGVDGVNKFRERSGEIDVVIMDLTMPNMDGVTAMAEIRTIRTDCKVIIASGYNESEMDERISSQPPAGFIRKPYNMRELEMELQRVLFLPNA